MLLGNSKNLKIIRLLAFPAIASPDFRGDVLPPPFTAN
jgi:hypothetical protein